MAKNETDKIRLLAVERIISRGRRVSAAQILSELERRYDIKADRKTIYSDIMAIDRFMPVDVTGGRYGGFQVIDWEKHLA
jgi:predicted DNA-binding transcriptional regulator YafY